MKRKMTQESDIDSSGIDTKWKLMLSDISLCLSIAGVYGGQVFGGFVREVVIPYMNDQTVDISYKDVDIWFKNKHELSNFVRLMDNTGYQFRKHGPYEGDNNLWSEFKRYQYALLSMNGTLIAWINAFISDMLPVNDFDVNQYPIIYTNNIPSVNLASRPQNNIKNKQATILDSYLAYLHDPKTRPYHICRIYYRYLQRGWTIVYNGIVIPPRTSYQQLREIIKQDTPKKIPSDTMPENSNPKTTSWTAQDKLDILLKLETDIDVLRSKYIQLLRL